MKRNQTLAWHHWSITALLIGLAMVGPWRGASDGAADDQYGRSVAASGNTTLVGAPGTINGGAGAAYAFVQTANSLTFTVNSTADAPDADPGDGICADAAGKCTLRAAIQEADAQPSGSSITINVPAGTYGLTLGTLQLTANRITISGALSSTTTIMGDHLSAVMGISRSVQATISGVTLTGGNAGRSEGGGLLNAGLTVLRQSALISNTAHQGGGIANGPLGRLWLVGSNVRGNAANGPGGGSGGGLSNSGTVTITTSTLSHNTAGANGGGIANSGTLNVAASTLSSNQGAIFNTGTLRVANSILSNNMDYEGAGIDNVAGRMTVTASTLSSNSASSGGGIYNTGTLSVIASSLSGNGAALLGAGISNNGTLTITNSTLSDNGATNAGGGIDNERNGTLNMTTSILSNNTANQSGGGIYNSGTVGVTSSTFSNNAAAHNMGTGGAIDNTGMLTVINSTLSNNAAANGGGIYNDGLVALTYDTIAFNSDGLNNNNFSGTAAITGTIVANSTSGHNCSGPITDHGYNLDSGTSCGFSQSTDITNTDPLLGPLADNGGPTQTMALLPGSPAIDEGGTHANGCPATDQRGLPRPDELKDNGACDMGAFESQGIG